MLFKKENTVIFVILLLVTQAFSFHPGDKKYIKEIPFSGEKELKVNIESALGKLTIVSTESYNVIKFEIIREEKFGDPTEQISYQITDGVGFMKVPVSKKEEKRKTFKFSSFEGEHWKIYFTDRIPISFDIELGAGKGYFDFTNICVKDLNISTGASSVVLKFDKVNSSTIDNINIESGVSKFKAYNLLNANFNNFRFSGGVGLYELDFGGELNKEVDINIELGLGSLNMFIPKYVGAKVLYEKSWISNIDIGRGFNEENEDEYVTDNYYNTKAKMNIKFDTGVGSIKLKRVK